MIKLDTLRLELKACLAEDFEAIACGEKICAGYETPDGWPEPDLSEALPVFAGLMRENGPDGFNLWVIADKKTRGIIGSAGYAGRPDEQGGIEIGFGIIPARRQQGYCREAAAALMLWGLDQPGVKFIKAACAPDNAASRATLLSLGFHAVKETAGLIEWVYGRGDNA